MLGWLKKKGENSRVYMCTKEVLWDLEAATPTRRALLLAMAQALRVDVLARSGIPEALLSRPLDYPRDDLMLLYGKMEDVRNTNTYQLAQLHKGMKRLGMELPAYADQHAKVTGRALEVWMVTVGAGVAPDLRDEARRMWQYLIAANQKLPEAIVQIRTIAALTEGATGEVGGMFDGLTDEAWIEACRFVPQGLLQRSL